MITNSEHVKIVKNAVVDYSKLAYRNSPVKTEENGEEFQTRGSWDEIRNRNL
jgi:hypothetical protein